MTDFELSASVGVGETNDPADVRALKRRFVDLGFDWLTVDGTVDEELEHVISLFQSIKDGRHRVRGDGRVTVPAQSDTWTYPWLQADDAPHWQRMTRGDRTRAPRQRGFVNYELADPTDDHEYGTDWMAATIRGAGAYYRDNYLTDRPRAPALAVNDVSRPRGQETPDHAGHETGMACDLRLPRTDGGVGGVLVGDDDYDRDAVRGMLRAIRMQPRHSRTLLSDGTLAGDGLCTVPDDPDVRESHRNHAHVELRPLFPLTGYAEPFDELLLDAIETFGGVLVNPGGYEMTVDGFDSYLDDVGAEHFDADEVASPNHEDEAKAVGYETLLPPRRWWTRAAAHVKLADDLRSSAGESARMRNFWRPPDYNDRPKVDGADRSDHIVALAVDLDFETVEGKEAAQRRLETLRTTHDRFRLRYVTYERSPRSIHASVLSPKGTGHVQL